MNGIGKRRTTKPKNMHIDDWYLCHTDAALDAAIRKLQPLTREMEVSEITELFLQQVRIHLSTELCAIFNGPMDDDYHELSDGNKKFSERFRKINKLDGKLNQGVAK